MTKAGEWQEPSPAIFFLTLVNHGERDATRFQHPAILGGGIWHAPIGVMPQTVVDRGTSATPPRVRGQLQTPTTRSMAAMR